ncbi:MAG: OsmC family peroxiredoxin [Candidatus Moranbacteria bacterium]|nr:OsmC family peroxiredoxin [Candidatus Moranbacteria bacterium]
MAMKGKAVVFWSGSLMSGNGHAELESGAVGKLPIACPKEGHSPEGKSGPEELLAAAHASCFSMALSQVLTMQRNRKIEQLRVEITTTLDQVKKDEPYIITREEIDITGKVGDMDEAGFMQVVEKAKTMCAVGLALKGNVEMVYNVNFNSVE